MSLVEFIGFIVSLAAMIFLIVKRVWDETQRRRNPEKYAHETEEQEQTLKEFLKSLDMDLNSEKGVPPQHPSVAKPKKAVKTPYIASSSAPHKQKVDKFQFKSSLDDHHQETSIEKRTLKTSIRDPYRDHIEEEILSSEFRKGEKSAYEIINVRKKSRASKIIHGLPSAKDMLVIKEIFGPPKSMRRGFWD